MKKTVGDKTKQSVITQLPRKREQNLVVDDGLPDELLVYDLDRHKAHCLNLSAALVWKNCDGKSTASEIARRVRKKLDQEFPEDAVWLALRQLEKLRLLEKSAPMPARIASMSRRQLIRGLSIAAVIAVPVITSIVAPTAAEAGSCVLTGDPCATDIPCCSVLGCNTGTGLCR